MAKKVSYVQGKKSSYLALTSRSSSSLYFCTDTKELFKGDDLYSDGLRIVSGYDALPELSIAAEGILYFCEDNGNGYVLNTSRDSWIPVIHGVDNETIHINSDGLMSVKSVPISVVNGLEERLVEIEQTASLVTIATKEVAGIVKASDEVTVDTDGTMKLAPVQIGKVVGLEERLANIEAAAVGGVHYRGSVATKEDLPGNAMQGDLYECIDTGVEYCWNGEKWFEYGSTHFVPVEGAGIGVDGSTIYAKLSAVDGNALVIGEDNGLYVPTCGFTDKDRVTLDTLPMLYVTTDEMDEAINTAIENNSMAWIDLDAEVGVARIGNAQYPTIASAIVAAKSGDTIYIVPGEYSGFEFTKATKPNITIVGEDGVYVKKVRLAETTNYSAPDGLTLKNITFNGEGIVGNDDQINNLSVVGCSFDNGAVIHIGGVCSTNGLIVKDCKFNGTNSNLNLKEKTAVLVQGTSKNVVISNNTINDCEFNAIQVINVDGSMLIDGNVIAGTGSRAMRITTKSGAVLAIMNNTITNTNTDPAEAEENAGEIIKITGAVVDGALANNTCDGNKLVFNGGIAKVVE